MGVGDRIGRNLRAAPFRQHGRNSRGLSHCIPFQLSIGKIDNLLGVKKIEVKDRTLREKIKTVMG